MLATPLCWSAGGVVVEAALCVEVELCAGVVAFDWSGAGMVFEFGFVGLDDDAAVDWLAEEFAFRFELLVAD